MKKIRTFCNRIVTCVLAAGMIVSGIPATDVSAAQAPTVYAAAYQDAEGLADTTLPNTILYKGTDTPVKWVWKDNRFPTPYETVVVTGKIDGNTAVKARVEVIPREELVYFVDSGRDGANESAAFEAVKTLIERDGGSLKNSSADQTYSSSSGWGRTGSNFRAKGTENLDVADKFQTGWYSSDDNDPLTYQYQLDPGNYTLTAGFYEWWNGRSMKLALSGSGMASVTSGTATVNTDQNSAVETMEFTVNSACTVTMQVQNATGGQAPVISWFSIARDSVAFPSNPEQEVDILIDGAEVEAAAENINGLTYKGYGLISGNSTSDLLMDYKAQSPEAYEEMLQVLFGGEHPVINHVKMELGNDGNNSTGADSCTMRWEDDEADVSRSPGFQLAADAKAVNPDLKVSFLYWERPNWVQAVWDNSQTKTTLGYNAMYKWFRETVFDAYEKYGYVVDYISPDKNETHEPDRAFIKWFKNKLLTENDFPAYMSDPDVQDLYHNIKIIASDENKSLEIVPAMREDQSLYNTVDVIGFHYNTGTQSTTLDYRKMADEDDKEIWFSEGCATFSFTEYHKNKTTDYGGGTIGGYQSPLALMDNFVKSFVYSRKTHYIFQPAIGSFYEGAQYDHKEILSARDPWSGNMHYDPVIYMLRHFTKFSVAGWENESNDAGIWRVIPTATSNTAIGTEHLENEDGTPSYMTLAAPDKSNYSVVIVNNSSKTLNYNITDVDMNLSGNSLEIWETKTDSYMQYKGEAEYDGDCHAVTLEPYSMVTLTTLDCKDNPEYSQRLPEETEKTVLDTDGSGRYLDDSNEILYADDYEYEEYGDYSAYGKGYLASRGNEPRYTVDFSGAFVVEDGILKQVLNQSVNEWNWNDPNCVIGDFRWMNYKTGIDVVVGTASGAYAGLAIRQQTGMGFEGSGYNLRISRNGNWTLKKRSTTIATGSVAANTEGAYHLALEGREDVITAYVNGAVVETFKDSSAEYFGRVRLGCGWNETAFDNLLVEKLDGYQPYAAALIDNASDAVTHSGSWNITVAGDGASNNDWYRSLSTTSASGSSFQFEMTGVGFALIGPNNGSAVLDIKVDGESVNSSAVTKSSNQHGATFIQSNLKDKTYHSDIDDVHNVIVTVKSGTLVLDAIMPLTTPVAKGDLKTTFDEARSLDSSLYTPDSYARLTEALTAAQEALTNENAGRDTINDALQKLRDAIHELVKTADKSVLQSTINKAKALNNNEYTADSYAQVKTALAAAQTVLNDAYATQAAVDSAAAALNTAINHLKKKEVTPPVVQKVPLAAPTIKSVQSQAAKTGPVVKITVNKVSNADTYTVYRKIGNKVTTVGTAAGGVVTDKKPVSGKKASYYAAAISKNEKYSNSSNGKTKTITLAKDTSKVTVKKAKKGVTVSFKKVKKAKGYLVYRSTKKNGTYRKLTKKPITKLTYTDKKAKAKKTYYYKVVTYGKNKTYSKGKISAKIKR